MAILLPPEVQPDLFSDMTAMAIPVVRITPKLREFLLVAGT